jgi:hypothetical protein
VGQLSSPPSVRAKQPDQYPHIWKKTVSHTTKDLRDFVAHNLNVQDMPDQERKEMIDQEINEGSEGFRLIDLVEDREKEKRTVDAFHDLKDLLEYPEAARSLVPKDTIKKDLQDWLGRSRAAVEGET